MSASSRVGKLDPSFALSAEVCPLGHSSKLSNLNLKTLAEQVLCSLLLDIKLPHYMK
jgi:hypothetical protein